MNYLKSLAVASSLLYLCGPIPVLAQDEEEEAVGNVMLLENIIVTGRKREETLMDVPVSTSVVTGALIEDAGITDLYDLFEMVPGLHYDEGTDRLAALPSIRGIQANDVAPNRTKVTAFVDGIPVLGSIGSIGFDGFQQVEVYRGPQSAAFGRSTFAGAINYVTRDPGEEFEGNVGINVSDYGTRTANISFGGPITENLGFLLNYSKEDSGSPSEYHANGDYGNRIIDDPVLGPTEVNVGQGDGTEYGARTGDNFSGKLVFEPDDSLKMSLTFNHVETHDQQAPTLFLTQEERDACFEDSGVFVNLGMMAPWLTGEIDCNWDDVRGLYAQHDIEGWLIDNPLNLAEIVTAAQNGVNSMGVAADDAYELEDGRVLTIEQQILMMAQAYSIPESDRGTLSERDRFTFQVDKLFDNGSAVQFSYMQSEETFQRANATGFYYYDPDNVGLVDDTIMNTYDMFSDGVNIDYEGPVEGWRIRSGMGAPRVPNPSFGDIEEKYAEVRWVSPAENRLSYVVGASYYDYDFVEERWGGAGMGAEFLAAAAQFNGIVEEFMELSGFDAAGVTYAPDDEVIGEKAENTAVFFNVGYDLTDQLTLSAEGRYANDVVSAENSVSQESREVTTKSFVPRISLTYDVNESTSFYVQWAKGVNPAGINVGVLSADSLALFAGGVPNGLIPYDATIATTDVLNNDTGDPIAGGDGTSDAYDADNDIWYTDETQTTPLLGETYISGFSSDDFSSFDEEEISQFEIGFKGNALDGRLTYAGAVYSIDWKDQIQNGAISLDSPCASGPDAGDSDPTLAPCTSVGDGMDYMYVAGSPGANIDTALNFGDVKIWGAEIEGNYRVTDNIDIRAQASIMKGEYDEFCDISLFEAIDFSELNGVTELPDGRVLPDYLGEFGLEIRRPGTAGGGSIASDCYVTDGNELAEQPELSFSISPSYNTDIGSMRFSARLDVRHEGEQFDNSGNFSYYPAVTTANLSLGLSGDQWSATLYVNNLTDDDTPRSVGGFPDDTSQMGLLDFVSAPNTELTGALGETWLYSDLARDSFSFQPRTPRTIGLRANYRF